MVVGLTDRQWRGLVKVLDMGAEMEALARATGLDLAEEGNRFRARAAITAIFAPWFAARPLAEIGPMFDAAGLTWAPFRSFAEAVRLDPDLDPDNPMIAFIDQPGMGPLPAAGYPANFSALPRLRPAPAPRLGQHSEAVLAEVLGLGAGQIGALMDRGVVAGP
jgi:2-methylfumaryl-CoA isomerase